MCQLMTNPTSISLLRSFRYMKKCLYCNALLFFNLSIYHMLWNTKKYWKKVSYLKTAHTITNVAGCLWLIFFSSFHFEKKGIVKKGKVYFWTEVFLYFEQKCCFDTLRYIKLNNIYYVCYICIYMLIHLFIWLLLESEQNLNSHSDLLCSPHEMVTTLCYILKYVFLFVCFF